MVGLPVPGTLSVGATLSPGTWRAANVELSNCATLNGIGGTLVKVIANDNGDERMGVRHD
jgi:hypothetical protein